MLYLTRQQVRDIDRRAIEEYHIPGIVLMENAARAATKVAISMLRKLPQRRALILCGGGNNGGDGLAVARHLHNRGIELIIGLCTEPEKYSGDALINYQIVTAMKLPCCPTTPELISQFGPGLIVDAIYGTGLTQRPRPPFAQWAAAVAQSGQLVLAIDLPSGLECDLGIPFKFKECIKATQTITFVARKFCMAHPRSKRYTGKVTVGDIGCPVELFR